MIVLDTHALIWVLEGSPQLGRRAARIANRALAADQLLTSAITFWEISLLVSRRRLRLAVTPEAFHARVLNLGIEEAPVTGAVALRAGGLARSLGDPADCLIAATAILRDAKLLTADAHLLESSVVATIDAGDSPASRRRSAARSAPPTRSRSARVLTAQRVSVMKNET